MKIKKLIIPILAGLLVTGIVFATVFDYTQGGTDNASYNHGDIIYFSSSSDAFVRLGTSTDGYVLTLVSNVPAWAVASGGGSAATWETVTVNAISPTSTIGIIVNASSTVDGLTMTDATSTGKFVFSLPADKNITIDARTNPRTITMGAMRWNHTPDASTPNTRALFLDIDANSVPNTQGLHIDLKATLIAAGETIIGLDIVGDTADSMGGVIRLIELDKTGIGSAEVHGIHIEPEIAEVIHHASGIFIDPTQGWDENGGFASTTHAFGSSTLNVTIFNADDDAIYIGADAVFQEVEVIMNTGASNPGIKPTFAISTAGVYAAITPIDNTAGFRESGLIDLEDVDLSSWAATTTNSVSKFYLRITRTQNSLGTDPIETLIQTAAVTDYIWDESGNLNLNGLTVTYSTTTGTLVIPVSSSLSLVQSGQFGIDTTTGQLRGHDGTAQRVYATDLKAFTIGPLESPVSGDQIPNHFKAPYGMTITQVDCLLDPTDSTGITIDIDIFEADGNGDSTTTIFNIPLTVKNTNTATSTFANAVIDSGDWVGSYYSNASGTASWISCTVKYRITAD